jgi:hypothetical protein
MRIRRWLLVLWLCFLARGAFYACALPLWEGFDEYAHYARIEYLAAEGHEPSRDAPVPKDVANSLAHVPAHDVGISFDEYWKRPEAERASGIPLPQATIYEAQQPPLFYWLFAALYRLTGSFSLGGRVLFLRLLSVVVASAAVPLTFGIGRCVPGDAVWALRAAALTVVLPLPFYTATHVSNECLAIALGSAVVWLTLRRAAIPLGLALGLALLTKAYFLAFIPPIGLLLFTPSRKKMVAALAGAAAISGWWYWHTWNTTGSLTGHNVLVGSSLERIVHAIPHFPLIKALDFGWTTFIWTGNWSFLQVRSWMYRAMGVVVLISLCGVGRWLWRRNGEIALLAAFVGCFAAACVYLGLGSFAAGASPGASGWYACCAIAAFAVLLTAGWRAVLPRRFESAGPAFLAIAFSAIDLFGTFFYSLPYYTGLISHTHNGGLPACRLPQLANGGFFTMLHRLTLGKPGWLGVSVMVLLCILWGIATVFAICVTISTKIGVYQANVKVSTTNSRG